MEGKKSRIETKPGNDSIMGQDLFKNLPSELLLNILSRVPAESTFSCKCVCKPWFDMLMTDEFVKSHLSRSVLGLAVCQVMDPMRVCVYEEVGCKQTAYPRKRAIDFNMDPAYNAFQSSVNGLLFLNQQACPDTDHLICNPITCETIRLPTPVWSCSMRRDVPELYGFGVSKLTGQYKVVRIFTTKHPDAFAPVYKSRCQLYTVGTGSWRHWPDAGPYRYGYYQQGLFMNGNIHWLVRDSELSPVISCFDLETELFSFFVSPSLPFRFNYEFTLCVLNDCLCLCNNSKEDDIVIWSMKEYGDGNSWRKEFIISRATSPIDLYGVLQPIKVFENGDILIAKEGFDKLFCYSTKTKTIRVIDLLGLYNDDTHKHTKVITYSPSIVSLKVFTKETEY